MKWFVTDAQLAQMRLAIEQQALRIIDERAAADHARHMGEIARLREDREKELARLVDPTGPLVAHYREEVTFWRKQFLAERQRADIALDQCRVTHQGIGPVSLPPREDRLPREMETLFQTNPELAAMGSTDGV